MHNGGIAKTKGRWQIGSTCDVLVAVVLRFWCGEVNAMRQELSVISAVLAGLY